MDSNRVKMSGAPSRMRADLKCCDQLCNFRLSLTRRGASPLAGKFFNILLSVLLNGTELLPTQWGAVGMVFTGLLVSSISKSKAHKKVKAA